MKKLTLILVAMLSLPFLTNAQTTAVQGGTGLSTYSQGDIIYAGSSNPIRFTKLNIGLSGTCLTSSGSTPSWGSCGSGTFSFTPVAGGNSTSTLLYFYNGLYSNAASTTIKYASTTAISAQSICLTGDICRTTWPTGGGSGFWPFIPVAGGNATSSLLYLYNGVYTLGSSTLQYASTTNISSTQGAQLATSGGGVAIGATTVTAGYKLDVVGGGAQFGGSLALTTGDLNLPGAGNIYFLTRGIISAPTNGELILYNYAGTDFTRLDFGGNTSAFPSLGRTLNALNVIAGDGTTNARFDIGTTTPNAFATMTVASNTPYLVITKTNAPTDAKHIYLSNQDGTLVIGTTTDTFTSTSSPVKFAVSAMGHRYASTTAPTLSSGAIDGTDAGGRVVGCTSACTITFAQPYARTPSCIIQAEAGSVTNTLSYTPTASSLVVTETSLGTFNFRCEGQ